MISITKIRYIWLTLLGVVIIGLLYKAIVPQGMITYFSNFSKYSYFISEFSPRERIEKDSQGLWRLLVAEPIYFYVRPPRAFDTTSVTLTFNKPAPLMELGICREKNSWNFERQPLYFQKLEELIHNQEVLHDQDLLLWQREKKYSSITDFIENPPTGESIALYNYALSHSVTISDYKLYDTSKEYDLGLRGAYSFLTYSNGEPIDVTFSVANQDTLIKQPIVFSVYNDQGNTVYDETVILNPKVSKQPNSISTKLSTRLVQPGMYRVEVKTSDVVVTEKILTRQSRLAFLNRLSFVDASRKNFSVFSDSTNLQAQTLNPQSLQTISINNDQLSLSETYRQFSVIFQDQTRSIKEIKLASDDIVLAGDGVFSFSPLEIINPLSRQFTNKTNVELSDIDYVLAKYEPIGLSGPFSRTIDFTIKPTCTDGKGIPFMIASPEMDSKQPIEVFSVEVSFIGKTLLHYLSEKFR